MKNKNKKENIMNELSICEMELEKMVNDLQKDISSLKIIIKAKEMVLEQLRLKENR